MMSNKFLPLAVAGVLALSACSGGATTGGDPLPGASASATAANPTHGPAGAKLDEKGVTVYSSKTKQGAPQVVIFTDPQCPICAQFEAIYGDELLTLAEKGDIGLRYVTLTFLDKNLKNDSSARASRALACSADVDAFGEYTVAMFHDQPDEGKGYTDAMLRDDFAKKAGLSGAKLTTFQSCYDSKAKADVAAKINENGTKELYEAAKQVGSPSITVNGKSMPLNKLPKQPSDLLTAITSVA